MRKSRFFILGVMFGAAMSLQTSYAQDYARWGLPEGAKVRLGKGWISGNIAYSPDGTLLAVASSIGVWLYDANTGAEVNLLSGHTRPVRSVEFSPDGAILASCGADGDNTVRLWDVRTGKLLNTFEGHANQITSVAISPDGSTLAAGDGRIIPLWNVRTGERTRTLRGHTSPVLSLAFSPDGGTLASGSKWNDNTVRLWNPRTGEHLDTLEGHSGGVLSLAFSPDGRMLASGDLKRVRLWDVHSSQYLGALGGQWETVPSRSLPTGGPSPA